MDLLRWFRFLWAVEVPWDRASRIEARDFSRWLQVAGQPTRPHWRRPGEAGRWAAGGKPYAPSVRAHSETVLRSFYNFHRDIGTGPVLNPFPLDRSRRGRRAHAHRNPMDPPRKERAGLYRPTLPKRVPRSVPDEEFQRDLRPALVAPGPGPSRTPLGCSGSWVWAGGGRSGQGAVAGVQVPVQQFSRSWMVSRIW
ncbi:hypothetical protein ACFO9E_12995 [Streptomyces maoxianensis]|uniref:Integrase SAM-like N-terminal domain-containing protein n=1 Tax=Streptomyces maoxianensis TaxID=1459942 RepID=A0ABV9G3G0_9ACTN